MKKSRRELQVEVNFAEMMNAHILDELKRGLDGECPMIDLKQLYGVLARSQGIFQEGRQRGLYPGKFDLWVAISSLFKSTEVRSQEGQ